VQDGFFGCQLDGLNFGNVHFSLVCCLFRLAVQLPVKSLPIVYTWECSAIPFDHILEHIAEASPAGSTAPFLYEMVSTRFQSGKDGLNFVLQRGTPTAEQHRRRAGKDESLRLIFDSLAATLMQSRDVAAVQHPKQPRPHYYSRKEYSTDCCSPQ
jgi:hypothetical protein